MRVRKDSVEVRTLGLEDLRVIDAWAAHLRPQWGENARDQLQRAEHRVGAYLPEHEYPIGYAGITPDGSPDGLDEGALWLDFLYVDPQFRGLGLQEILYDRGQLPYAKRHAGRRILRVPINPRVVEFSTKRGWRKTRDLPGTSYRCGVYELPRERLS